MRALLLLLALLPGAALAQPYAEVGVGYQPGGCMYRWRMENIHAAHECSRSPLGMVAIGYKRGPWSLRWEHWSSIADSRDRGVEMISVRYRFEFR